MNFDLDRIADQKRARKTHNARYGEHHALVQAPLRILFTMSMTVSLLILRSRAITPTFAPFTTQEKRLAVAQSDWDRDIQRPLAR